MEEIATAEELRGRLDKFLRWVTQERLPGWEEYLDNNSEAYNRMDGYRLKVDDSIKDADEILFERAVGGLKEAWEKINLAIAEKYRELNPDPETWELRYVRWMKIKYMKFGCEMGTFYVVPKKPERRPKAKHWFTVDEMLDILNCPATVAAIKAFKQMPVRPDSLPSPGEDEKHLVANFTDDGRPPVYYRFRGDRFGKGGRGG